MSDAPPPAATEPPAGASGWAPLSVALIYAACASAWILFSDKLLALWLHDAEQLALAGAVKGWLFVAVTAALLYALLRQHTPAAAAPGATTRVPRRLLALVGAMVVALTLAAIVNALDRHKRVERQRLQAMADLKMQLLVDWLHERKRDASMLSAGADAAARVRRWHDEGDVQARTALFERLTELVRLTMFDAVSVVGEDGTLLWRSDGRASALPAEAAAGLRRLARQREISHLGPYLDDGGRPRTDIVAPLPAPPGEAAALLVFHLEGPRYLPETLMHWPAPTATGDVVVVRRDGDEVQFLTALQRAPGAALRLRQPMARTRLLAVQLMTAGRPGATALDGINIDGDAAFGHGAPVPGTDWFLYVKMDTAELYAGAVQEGAWILLAGALALFVAAAALHLDRQRRQLVRAAQTQQAQRERLQAMAMLQAVVDSSVDAVYAKDTEGRYLLWNRAAAQSIGRPSEDVVGHDDHAVFPPHEAEMLRARDREAMAAPEPLTREEPVTTPTGPRIFLATKGPLRDAEGRLLGTFGISRDITEARRAELALRRANRALTTSQECGQALVRAGGEADLLDDICRILVRTGGYRMAWVGYAEHDAARRVRPVAHAGFEDGFLDDIGLTWADEPAGRGPTGTAIREQRVVRVRVRDVGDDSQLARWRDAALARGYAAAVAMPLLPRPGECIGALTLYAATPDAFDDEELRLVAALGDDLAYGIRALRDREARLEGERLLREQKERLAESQRLAHVGTWVLDWPTQTLSWSDETFRLYGLPPGDTAPTLAEAEAAFVAEDRDAVRAWITGAAAGQDVAEELECRAQRPGGAQRILNLRCTVERDAAGRPLRLVGTVQDVTAAREAAAERLAQEARYRGLFASNPHPMWVYDVATLRFLEVNDAAVARYGYTREQFLAMTIADIRPAEDLPRLQAVLARRDREAYGERSRWRHRLADGRLIDVEISAHPIDFDGRAAAVVLAHDVTEQRRAELALQASEADFRALTEQVPAIIFRASLDAQSTTTYVSPAIEALGWTAQEWLADAGLWVDNLHPEDRERVLATVNAANTTGGSIDMQYRLRDRHGRWRQFHEKSAVVHGPDGRPRFLQGLMLDVTAQMQAEASLRQLSQAVEQSPNSIVVTNLQAEIEYVNQAFLDATGYTRDELIGRNPRVLHGDDVRPGRYDGLWAALTAGRAWKGEFHNKRKDGRPLIELGHVAPLRQPDGRITHYVAVKEDITERKRIEGELERYRHHLEELVQERTTELAQARQRAEAASLAKSTFLANMSHEIRTPMNAIVGLSYLLQHEPMLPRQAERLAQIDASAQHLLSIITGILDLSKIEAGKMVLEGSDFEVDALLDHVRSMVAERARRKGVALHVDAGDVPPWLHGDLVRLRQALLNFADNAVKFTERGEIRLRARLLEQGPAGLLVRFEVQDTGIGIDAAALPRLFEVFEQADASTTRRYGGTGLGLAVSRRLAQLMGGTTGVSSEPGFGSTFWLTARLGPGRGESPSAALPAPDRARDDLLRHCRGAHVLLVEDDAINREVALELLGAAGLVTSTAANGHEALGRVGDGCDLVLMDIQMPGMDGYQATRAIRALPGTEHLPIVAMTGNAFEEDRRACLAAGMNDFVPKPVEPERLYLTLRRWLPRRAGDASPPPAPAEPAAAPPPSARREALAVALDAIDGLAIETSLAALHGDLALYATLLQRLAHSHGSDAGLIAAHLAAGRLDDAQQLTHRLKGAAGAVGALALQDAASALDDSLRRREPPPRQRSLCLALAEVSTRLFRAVADLPAAPDDAGKPVADGARTHAVLRALEPLIAADDTAAADLFRRHRALLHATLGDAVDLLAQQLERYDYPQALQTVRQVLATAVER